MTRMPRLLGLILIVLGVIVGAVGAIPSRLAGRLNGVGGSDHLTADGLVLVGALLVLGGLVVALRRAPGRIGPVAQGGPPVGPQVNHRKRPPLGRRRQRSHQRPQQRRRRPSLPSLPRRARSARRPDRPAPAYWPDPWAEGAWLRHAATAEAGGNRRTRRRAGGEQEESRGRRGDAVVWAFPSASHSLVCSDPLCVLPPAQPQDDWTTETRVGALF